MLSDLIMRHGLRISNLEMAQRDLSGIIIPINRYYFLKINVFLNKYTGLMIAT